MKLKTLIVTVAILAALSLVAYYSGREDAPPPPDSRVGQALLDAGAAGAATRITLTDQGKTVVISKRQDGTWSVDSYFGLKADFSKLSQFVSDLTSAKISRFVTASPDRLARMEFKDTRIELSDAAGKPLWAIVLGKTPDNGSGRFFEFSGEKRAFLTGLNAWIDSDSKNWADSQLTAFKDADIAQIDLALADLGPLRIVRKSPNDSWASTSTPTGRTLKTAALSSLLSTLSSIRFTETNDLKDAAVSEAARSARTVVLTSFSGKTTTLVIARKPEEKRLKAPAPAAGGPASLGKLTDVAPKETSKAPDIKPITPEYETIPAGPVFVSVLDSDAKNLVNNEMKIRAFQTDETVATALPSKSEDLFEPVTQAPAPAAKP